MKKIEEISDKLVELYGKWVKIQSDLNGLKDVEAKPINNINPRKSSEPRGISTGKRPNK